MSFLETVRRAKAYLEEQGRVSLRALKREFDLDERALEDLADELVEIQRVAVREGRALAWAGSIQRPEIGGPQPAKTDAWHPAPDRRCHPPEPHAERVRWSAPALEGEPMQVTVLCAAVTGWAELNGQLDPAERHEVRDRLFQILTEGVHRFEGTVNEQTGDGILALFGAPIAHADHAQRACHAALHLRDELRRYAEALRLQHGLHCSLRIGLDSGEVVVAKIGGDLCLDYPAQGVAVGLARRMESLAEANGCALSQSTADLVSGEFDLEDLGSFRVDGVADPVSAFALRGLEKLHPATQLHERRAARHAAVARAIEDLHADKLDEHAALLAHHWREAGEPLAAAHWLARAALAAGRNDYCEATRCWSGLLDLLESIPKSQETMELGLQARAHLLVGWARVGGPREQVAAVFEEGRKTAEELGDAAAMSRLYNGYASVRLFEGYVREAADLFEQALGLVEGRDPALELSIRYGLGTSRGLAGPLGKAIQTLDEAIELGGRVPEAGPELIGFRPYPSLFSVRSLVLGFVGRFADAARDEEIAASLARLPDDRIPLAVLGANRTLCAECHGNLRGMIARLRPAAARLDEAQGGPIRVFSQSSLARAHLLAGKWRQALEVGRGIHGFARQHGTGLHVESLLLTTIARALLAAGSRDQARATAREAVQLARERGQGVWELIARLDEARIEREIGEAGADRIGAMLDEALRLTREVGMAALRPQVLEERARVQIRFGDEARGHRLLREAHANFVEIGATGHAERLAAELGC